MLPDPIKNLANILTSLPSLGPRQAMRLAFYIAELPSNQQKELIHSLESLSELKKCTRCFFIHSEKSDLCSICFDTRRDQNLVAIIEKETDRISMERAKDFSGRYLVLGKLSKDGVLSSEHKRRIKTLTSESEEIILALSPTAYGDINAAVIQEELKDLNTKITRLGRGIPTGGEIEFADEETLLSALKNRH